MTTWLAQSSQEAGTVAVFNGHKLLPGLHDLLSGWITLPCAAAPLHTGQQLLHVNEGQLLQDDSFSVGWQLL